MTTRRQFLKNGSLPAMVNAWAASTNGITEFIVELKSYSDVKQFDDIKGCADFYESKICKLII